MKPLFRLSQKLPTFSSLAALLWLAPLAAHAESYTWITNNGTITITRYVGGGAVTIPANITGLPVTTIGEQAFSYTDLTSITIPYGIRAIGSAAFECCTSLTNVTIPNSITTIGHSAFGYCTSLEAVTIPASVVSIGECPFECCGSLTTITVDKGNPSYSSVDGVLFDRGAKTLLEFPVSGPRTYTIPNSVTAIGHEAFMFCDRLTSVTLAHSVTSIGEEAFLGCTNLTFVTIPNSVTNIGNSAFYRCDSLAGLTIPNSVTSIGIQAFGLCFALTNVTIPNSVTNIGTLAFYVCPSLTNVTIGTGITTIGDAAFYCLNLTNVFFNGHAPTNANSQAFHDTVRIYHLPGTRGWGPVFANRPTAPWFLPQPMILTLSPDFGVQTGGLGFRVSWATNATLVLEACSSPSTGSWQPLATNALVDGWTFFSDPQWVNQPARFYRIRAQ